jgi:hypothetical protein
MGWTYTRDSSKQDIIDYLNDKDTTGKCWGSDFTILKSFTAVENGKSVHWQVINDKNGTPFIACSLIDNDNGYGYGYKIMDEGMGPYYYSCPREFLNMATANPNPAWRLKVLEYHGEVEMACNNGTTASNVYEFLAKQYAEGKIL